MASSNRRDDSVPPQANDTKRLIIIQRVEKSASCSGKVQMQCK